MRVLKHVFRTSLWLQNKLVRTKEAYHTGFVVVNGINGRLSARQATARQIFLVGIQDIEICRAASVS